MSAPVPYLIAEIGVNHDGDPARAAAMVRDAVAAGFDAVKFQYWIVAELLAAEVPNAAYQGAGDQRDLLAGLALELDDLAALRAQCRDLGVDFVCTADGVRAHSDVLTLAPDALKVGSGDNDNPWLLDAVAGSALPVYVSTGMSGDDEIVATLTRLGSVRDLTVLHCVTAYPTPLGDARLGRIAELRAIAGRPVGYSDHTLGSAAAVAALALGAPVIEKHVTWATPDALATTPGPDHAASLSLHVAAAWVAELRAVASALGAGRATGTEQANRAVVRKGLYAVADLDAGHRLGPDDLAPLRPLADSVPAGDRDLVVGRRLAHAVRAGDPVRPGDLDGATA
jgi:N,N'-diacetyllegionaminate synthase